MGRVAAIQMSSTDVVDENLMTVAGLAAEAAENQAVLIVLPENFAFIGKKETDKLSIAEALDNGPIQTFLSKLAKKLNIWIVAGTIPLAATPPRVSAACCIWDSEGQRVTRYDKIHLFDVQVGPDLLYAESNTILSGNEWVCVNSPIGRLGLSVCYDLRFPELYRKLLMQGAEVLLVPSAFTSMTGKAHWEPLLRARAIENFSYVVAPNQYGFHKNGRSSYGHSMIVDPYGQILSERSEGEGIIFADIDLNYVADLRLRFPVTAHRRIF